MDLDESVIYRLCYALAADLTEARKHNLPNRWRSNPAAGGSVEAIVAGVSGRLRSTGEVGRGLVREATEDAWEGRRPQSRRVCSKHRHAPGGRD